MLALRSFKLAPDLPRKEELVVKFRHPQNNDAPNLIDFCSVFSPRHVDRPSLSHRVAANVL